MLRHRCAAGIAALAAIAAGAGCGGQGDSSGTVASVSNSAASTSNAVFSAEQVTAEFKRRGITLMDMGHMGAELQLIAIGSSENVALVVGVLPNERDARLATEPAEIEGNAVPGLRRNNVILWIGRGASTKMRSHALAAMSTL